MMSAEKLRKNCFVIMGFGKKTDFQTGRTLDLDKTYRNIIKPAAEDAGLECFRADEIVHSGLIDVPMYEQLLKADVVVADLSASIPSVLYELGVRHALRPYSTVVIAEDKLFAVPFDVTLFKVRRYTHLGEDIGYGEVMRFRKELTEAIAEAADTGAAPDSPVYTFLSGLRPPSVLLTSAAAPIEDSVASRLEQAEQAKRAGDFQLAKTLLTYVIERTKAPDPYLIQQLALVTYKSKQPTEQAALEEARALLETLNPATSNDTETLGLWGAVHKRLWDLNGDAAQLDEAVRGYERGFYLRNDYYNGINLAFLLNVRSDASRRRADASASAEEAKRLRGEAVADFVQAERIRREVLSICDTTLLAAAPQDEDKYWVLSTMAEAYLGIGDEAAADQKLAEAFAIAPSEWMKESTEEQMAKLRRLLADSPLKSL